MASILQQCGLHGLLQLPNETAAYQTFQLIGQAYKPAHAYVSTVICFAGVLANILNVIVLTRPNMRSPVNVLLCAIAISDTLVMLSYLIFTIHFDFVGFAGCNIYDFSYGWGIFAVAHAHLSLVGHSSSIWISVCLAILRYSNIRKVGIVAQGSMRTTLMIVLSTICLVALANGPSFKCVQLSAIEQRRILSPGCFNDQPQQYADEQVDVEPKAYMPTFSDCTYCVTAFWITGILFKMLPCCILATFVFLLVGKLMAVKQRRERLLNANSSSSLRTGSATVDTSVRTTKMLITLITVFLATELPQGLMAILSGVFSSEFRTNIYFPLGNLLDLLSLINSTASFVIYCTMSRAFREAFVSTLNSLIRFLKQSLRLSVLNHHQTKPLSPAANDKVQQNGLTKQSLVAYELISASTTAEL